ncbi:MAG: hypothetical protein IT406_00680 [Candidatus Yanofskybacteria bacterium]|nr:hypothetical protein [Candidatus Yanofskybacteria bacterium]
MEKIITILITILLAYVAWQNYKINQANSRIQKDKLRLDLFERRLKVFSACQELFATILREANVDRDRLFKFLRDSSDVEFLFGDEIKTYLDEIYKKGLKLSYINQRLNSGSQEKREELAEEDSQILGWFEKQFSVSRDFFRKYLHFTINKG